MSLFRDFKPVLVEPVYGAEPSMAELLFSHYTSYGIDGVEAQRLVNQYETEFNSALVEWFLEVSGQKGLAVAAARVRR